MSQQIRLSPACRIFVTQCFVEISSCLIEERTEFSDAKLKVVLVCRVGLRRVVVVTPLVLEITWDVKELAKVRRFSHCVVEKFLS